MTMELKSSNTETAHKYGSMEAHTKAIGSMAYKKAKANKPGLMLIQNILETGKLE